MPTWSEWPLPSPWRTRWVNWAQRCRWHIQGHSTGQSQFSSVSPNIHTPMCSWCKPFGSGVNIWVRHVRVCVHVSVCHHPHFPVSSSLFLCAASTLFIPWYHFLRCTAVTCLCSPSLQEAGHKGGNFLLLFVYSGNTWILLNKYWWIPNSTHYT